MVGAVVENLEISLYVHVPFCAHKCEYCAFYSHAPGDLLQRFTDALVREARMLPKFSPRTIFFGGGTPSLLTLKQWEQIGELFRELGWTGAEEWSVECNPATVSRDKAELFRAIGVNRVSMGVQSFDEQLLERLGRIHSREQVFKSYEVLRSVFENINIDLMFAIPTQTMEVWKATLAEALALETKHFSCYEVIYEQDTPLYAQLQAGEFVVNEELACAMYEELVNATARAGFVQYEIANFAKDEGRGEEGKIPSYACKHNVNYWRGGFYYALGPSAAGYEPSGDKVGVRTRNWPNTQMYCEVVEKGQRPLESREELSAIGRAGEVAAFGLRMNAGWPYESFRRATGFDLRKEWRAEMEKLAADGLAMVEAERFRLNERGLRLADFAAREFLRT